MKITLNELRKIVKKIIKEEMEQNPQNTANPQNAMGNAYQQLKSKSGDLKNVFNFFKANFNKAKSQYIESYGEYEQSGRNEKFFSNQVLSTLTEVLNIVNQTKENFNNLGRAIGDYMKSKQLNENSYKVTLSDNFDDYVNALEAKISSLVNIINELPPSISVSDLKAKAPIIMSNITSISNEIKDLEYQLVNF